MNAQAQTDTTPPVQAFFERYGYRYSPMNETMAQFWDMCNNSYGWARDDPQRAAALDEVRDAIAMQFNAYFGGDVNSLQSWKTLCHVLRVKDVPDDLKGCKDVIHGVFANICDLVDHSLNESHRVTLFEDEVSLSVYSRASGKIYPKDNAYAHGLLRCLLRNILNPDSTRGTKQSGGRRRGRGRGV